MFSIVACPRCGGHVSLPLGTVPTVQVRCPLCSDQYSLGEILAALPPVLEVLDEHSAQTAMAAAPMVDAARHAPHESTLSAHAGNSTPAEMTHDEMGFAPLDLDEPESFVAAEPSMPEEAHFPDEPPYHQEPAAHDEEFATLPFDEEPEAAATADSLPPPAAHADDFGMAAKEAGLDDNLFAGSLDDEFPAAASHAAESAPEEHHHATGEPADDLTFDDAHDDLAEGSPFAEHASEEETVQFGSDAFGGEEDVIPDDEPILLPGDLGHETGSGEFGAGIEQGVRMPARQSCSPGAFRSTPAKTWATS